MKIRIRPAAGTDVVMDADELATAIYAYLAAHRINISGPRTVILLEGSGNRVRLNGLQTIVYVDPAGSVADNRPGED